MDHGMGSPTNMPPINCGTPPLIPPINYNTPPVHTPPPGAMNTSLDHESPSLQWPTMTVSKASTTAALIKSVAKTQVTKENMCLSSEVSNTSCTATSTIPLITTIAKVVVPTSVQNPTLKTENGHIVLSSTDKENQPLPPINHTELLNPVTVVQLWQ